MTDPARPPRVALLVPYASYWESAVPYDFRADREALADRAGRALADVALVVHRGLVDSREAGEGFAAAAAARDAEAVLVLQTMAAMPAIARAALDRLPGAGVVVWAAHRTERVPDRFDHAAITTEGATVGAPMLTNVLVRTGRPFRLVAGPVDDPATHRSLRESLASAAAAHRLARARIGRVGLPIDGYDSVDADDALLRAATGLEAVRIEPAEFRELYAGVSPERIGALEAETRELYEVSPDAEGEVLERSLRAAAALDELVERHRLDAGALNCHVPEIRFGDEVGIAPCFALGRSTSHGVPWTCTGDVVTAVAMLTLKLLGGAAQYHELECLDYRTGELVVASSGEHDLGFGDGSRPRLVRNGWYTKDPRAGACACFGAPRGPATLVGFTELEAPAPGYRYVIASGEFTGRDFSGVGTPWAGFRFARGEPAEAWTRWCRAGAGHHSAATPGDFASRVEAVAEFLGVDCVRV